MYSLNEPASSDFIAGALCGEGSLSNEAALESFLLAVVAAAASKCIKLNANKKYKTFHTILIRRVTIC